MVQYVMVGSGGPSGHLLFELADFVKASCGPENMSKRRLGGTFIGAVATLNFGVEAKPMLRSAILKTQATCSNRWVVDGVCKFLKVADLANIKNHKN